MGAHGEARAAAWYEQRGWRVLSRNWRCREGELDLVVGRDGTVAFCEVKARATERFGAPIEAVTAQKAARIRRLAVRWLAEEGDAAGVRGWSLRFDVASVLSGKVTVVEEAF